MSNKLYSEVVDQIEFSERVDDSLKSALYDWFQFREVADDDKFPFWFTRILNRDFDQYEQLLRIEPGVSTYDWLVTKYRELQHYNTGSTEREIDNDITTSDVGANTGTDTTTRTLVKTGSVTDELTHGKISTHSGGHTITDGTSVVNGQKVTADGRQKSTSGGYTDTETDGRTITNTQDIQTVGGDDSTTESRGWSTTDQKHLDKVGPMSISYTGGVAEPTAPSGASATGGTSGGTLDWTTASAQNANFGKDDNGEVITSHQGHIQTQDVRGVQGTLQKVRGYNQLTETNSGNVTETENRTETRNYSDIDNGTLTNSGKDTNVKTFNSATDTETVEVEGNRGKSNTKTITGGIYNVQNDSRLQQEIYTGRDESPAELLKKASQFIINTNAFEWLYNQLDVCFMGIYD